MSAQVVNKVYLFEDSRLTTTQLQAQKKMELQLGGTGRC